MAKTIDQLTGLTVAKTDQLEIQRTSGGASGKVTASDIVNLPLTPAASASPPANGDLVFEATSDTSLTVKYKGSDGVTRSIILPLE